LAALIELSVQIVRRYGILRERSLRSLLLHRKAAKILGYKFD
jgi:hypothetical protein